MTHQNKDKKIKKRSSLKDECIFAEDHPTKTNKPREREYGLLDDKIIFPEDFAELGLEIEKLFYGED